MEQPSAIPAELLTYESPAIAIDWPRLTRIAAMALLMVGLGRFTVGAVGLFQYGLIPIFSSYAYTGVPKAALVYEWLSIMTELACGAGLTLAVIGMFRRASWTRRILVVNEIGFAVLLTAGATIAPFMYETDVGIQLLFVGLSMIGYLSQSLAIPMLVVLIVRATRATHLPKAEPAINRAIT